MRRETDSHLHGVKVCSIPATICMNVHTIHTAETLQVFTGSGGLITFISLWNISLVLQSHVHKLNHNKACDWKFLCCVFTFLSYPNNMFCNIQFYILWYQFVKHWGWNTLSVWRNKQRNHLIHCLLTQVHKQLKSNYNSHVWQIPGHEMNEAK